MQLRPGLAEALRREKAAALSHEGAAAASAASEGGPEAYVPYRRRVHRYFQLAAHPHFFSCAQRTLLLTSILEAAAASGGAGLRLALLERSHVVRQVFPLHHEGERQALEEQVLSPSWDRFDPLTTSSDL